MPGGRAPRTPLPGALRATPMPVGLDVPEGGQALPTDPLPGALRAKPMPFGIDVPEGGKAIPPDPSLERVAHAVHPLTPFGAKRSWEGGPGGGLALPPGN